jgi:hypothetical protein
LAMSPWRLASLARLPALNGGGSQHNGLNRRWIRYQSLTLLEGCTGGHGVVVHSATRDVDAGLISVLAERAPVR